MKKRTQNEKKLSLKKLQMAKINNPGKILGGTQLVFENGCTFTPNASKPQGGTNSTE
ncbi:hypothetical protein V2E39_21775 [Chryseobacterium arthrosphaerae]|uniref:Bacteriocin n=1 Tax=Chryseobacterium arthrosphaerae TaxID=651561 RepID=A0ABU7R5F3_9FLAO|nr:hypothetical protein [Chryseobacterium arthrosphaerae]QUY55936.1 hypothetical protein I2F65_00765 [Chryseobacterium arthrosphaerae]UEQ75793.1 hypothetical protein J8N07_19415 [Chryseobacterium arthrosphaerae]WES97139.1 hypothetical protein P2W68_20185 [Chryseobacterium arthrosphaerae]